MRERDLVLLRIEALGRKFLVTQDSDASVAPSLRHQKIRNK